MKKKILCFGEVLWDTFAEGKKPGGAPMNVAMHLIQQGIDAVMASRVGPDASGGELVSYLKTIGLYSDLIQYDKTLPTCIVTVDLDEQNQATYTIPQPVSWDNIQPEESLIDQAEKADIIVFGSLASRNITTRETLIRILKSKALKVFDVNIRAPHFEIENMKSLGGMADVIKMNAEELDMLAGTELSHFSEKEKILFLSDFLGCKTICITRGGEGAIIYMNNQFFEHGGYAVNVVDTVGAGDAFLATFITGMLSSEDPNIILDNACAIGAFVAGSRGANPAYDHAQITKIRTQLKSALN